MECKFNEIESYMKVSEAALGRRCIFQRLSSRRKIWGRTKEILGINKEIEMI